MKRYWLHFVLESAVLLLFVEKVIGGLSKVLVKPLLDSVSWSVSWVFSGWNLLWRDEVALSLPTREQEDLEEEQQSPEGKPCLRLRRSHLSSSWEACTTASSVVPTNKLKRPLQREPQRGPGTLFREWSKGRATFVGTRDTSQPTDNMSSPNYYLCPACQLQVPTWIPIVFLSDDNDDFTFQCVRCVPTASVCDVMSLLDQEDLERNYGVDLNLTAQENYDINYKKDVEALVRHTPLDRKPWKGPRKEATQARRSTRHRTPTQRLTITF